MNVTKKQAEYTLILYDRWRQMRKRCVPKTSKSQYHGDKGIRVCRKWNNNFWSFFKWSKINGFKPELTLGRKNNYRNYSPSNCSWETYEEQNRNKTNSVLNAKIVAEIKWILKYKKSPTAIGIHYNIQRVLVSQIQREKIWKSISPKRPKNFRILLQLPDKRKRIYTI